MNAVLNQRPLWLHAQVPRDWVPARVPGLDLPPPDPRLRASVVIPVRNEASRLAGLITALAGQRTLRGDLLEPSLYEVVILLNNCTDETPRIARVLQENFPRLRLHVADIILAAAEAHVGRARQMLFDNAYLRLNTIPAAEKFILTTDADSRPAPDWLAQTVAEFAAGVDGVGGRVTLDPAEAAALPAHLRRLFLLQTGYRRALEEMRSLYAPQEHDSFPRHHQHFGASIAVTAAAYARAGGMPLRRSSEDVALYHAVIRSGGRFRHSPRVRVTTSARMIGRAAEGLADALANWNRQALAGESVLVECARAAEHRYGSLGLWCREHPDAVPPIELSETPEVPPPHARAEIHETLRALRIRVAALRGLSLTARLDAALQRSRLP